MQTFDVELLKLDTQKNRIEEYQARSNKRRNFIENEYSSLKRVYFQPNSFDFEKFSNFNDFASICYQIASDLNTLHRSGNLESRKKFGTIQSCNDIKDSQEPMNIKDLLFAKTARELEFQQQNEEILELLNAPSHKESLLNDKFRTQGGSCVKQFCKYSTRLECNRQFLKMKSKSGGRRNLDNVCTKLHFKKIIQPHTDESLGDCSFLNTCFHVNTCKYVHYEIDEKDDFQRLESMKEKKISQLKEFKIQLFPPQWISCDIRSLDMSILGKFPVIMADPPWDIHMELPYGTMSDSEMKRLDIPLLQTDGYIFLWVTGRAMELGRECLTLWGYRRVDELIWVKTNQLQRLIRTGRTGHWLNHGKEHCLIGLKGNPQNMNIGIDCDVVVSEVRETSHKPDEIYGIIERLSPGTRKLELFGRPHNVQPNWITLGNQLNGTYLVDPAVVSRYQKRYPNGIENEKTK